MLHKTNRKDSHHVTASPKFGVIAKITKDSVKKSSNSVLNYSKRLFNKQKLNILSTALTNENKDKITSRSMGSHTVSLTAKYESIETNKQNQDDLELLPDPSKNCSSNEESQNVNPLKIRHCDKNDGLRNVNKQIKGCTNRRESDSLNYEDEWLDNFLENKNRTRNESITSLSFESKLELSSWGLPESVLRKYGENGISTMFPWQVECLCLPGVLDGENLVYSAPTSAGKTLVAEIILLKRILESGKKGIFILPFVSITREKTFTLQKLFGVVGIRVEGFMGGFAPPGGFQRADIAICTIEKANNLINRLIAEKKLSDLGIIVVDELHMVGDSSRGYLLELLLTKVQFLSSVSKDSGKVQLIGMSATLPNLNVLATWLGAKLYCTDFRPVPLVEMVKIGKTLYNSQFNEIRELNQQLTVSGDTDHLIQLCLEMLLDGYSTLVFCPTKAWCEKIALLVASSFFSIGNVNSTYPASVAKEIRKRLDGNSLGRVIEALKHCPAGLDPVLSKSLAFGAAFHHAGLTFDERDIIEGAFRAGYLPVLIATSTLSSGVNLPARRVIIRSPNSGGKILETLVYRQMVGRAGRKGKDTKGESILMCLESEKYKAQTLLNSELPPISSCLFKNDSSLTTSMKRAILEVVVSGAAKTSDDIRKYWCCTLLSASASEDSPNSTESQIAALDKCIEYLLDNELARSCDGNNEKYLVASQLGSAILASGLSPDEGLHVFSELQTARKCFVLENELHTVYQVTPPYVSNAWPDLDWMTYLDIWHSLSADMQKVGELVGVEESFIVRSVNGTVNLKIEKQNKNRIVHQRFFAALALHDLIHEVPLKAVVDKYGATKGLLQALQHQASTFAGMVTIFCNRLGWNNLELLIAQYQNRLQFGIQSDLCDLVRLTLINGQRARLLFNAGIETVARVAHSIPVNIENLLINSSPFQSVKSSTGTGGFILDPMGTPLTIREASEGIVNEARKLMQKELGLDHIDWDQVENKDIISASRGKKRRRSSRKRSKSSSGRKNTKKISVDSLRKSSPVNVDSLQNRKVPIHTNAIARSDVGKADSSNGTSEDKRVGRTDSFMYMAQTDAKIDEPTLGNTVNEIHYFLPQNSGRFETASTPKPTSSDRVFSQTRKSKLCSSNQKKGTKQLKVDLETSSKEMVLPEQVTDFRPASSLLTKVNQVSKAPNCYLNDSFDLFAHHVLTTSHLDIDKCDSKSDRNSPITRLQNKENISTLNNSTECENRRKSVLSDDIFNISDDLDGRASTPQAPKQEDAAKKTPLYSALCEDLVIERVLADSGTRKRKISFNEGDGSETPSALSDTVLSTESGVLSMTRTNIEKDLNEFATAFENADNSFGQNKSITVSFMDTCFNKNYKSNVSTFIEAKVDKSPTGTSFDECSTLNLTPRTEALLQEKISYADPIVDKTSDKRQGDCAFHETTINMSETLKMYHELTFGNDSWLDSTQTLRIIDVACDGHLFEVFLKEWKQQTTFALSLACERKPQTPKMDGIGWKVCRKSKKRRSTIQQEQPIAGIELENSHLLLTGVAICWGQGDSYFINMKTTQKESINAIYPTPPLNGKVRIEARIDAIKSALREEKSVIRCWDVKNTLKILAKSGLGFMRGQVEDPRVASWMLDPTAKEKNIHHLVLTHCDSLLPALENVGSNFGLESLGICDQNPGSSRVRASAESVLVFQLTENLANALQEVNMKKAWSEVEMPNVQALAVMENIGMGFSSAVCEEQKTLMQEKLALLEEEAYQLTGHPFSLNSAIDVSRVLYRELHLSANNNAEPVNTRQRVAAVGKARRIVGGPTNKEALEKLKGEHRLPGVILEWRRIHHSLTKVVLPFMKEKSFSSSLEMERIFPVAHLFTATGRVTLLEPSLQNVPKDFGIRLPRATLKKFKSSSRFPKMPLLAPLLDGEPMDEHTVSLRHALVPRTNHVLVSADYCQLELRLLAHFCGDSKLLEVFNEEEDVFQSIASQIARISPEDVTAAMRQQAKQISYGIIYGMGEKSLGEALALPEEEAKAFQSQFRSRFPGIEPFVQMTLQEARKKGHVLTLNGRRRYFPGLSSTVCHVKAQNERQAMNTRIQGSAADLVKMATVAIDRSLRENFPKGGGALVLQLHDELIYEVSEEATLQVARLIKNHMENATQLSVPLPVKLKMGPSWGDMKSFTL